MNTIVLRAESTLSLLLNTYLANTEAVKANIGLVIETVASQNLLRFYGTEAGSHEALRHYNSTVYKWSSRINSLITGKVSEARIAGILLIKHTTKQSPTLFAENAPKWITHLVSALSKADIEPVYIAAIETLIDLMDVIRRVPGLQRDIVSTHMPRINQAVLALAEKSRDLTCSALSFLMFSVSWFPSLYRPLADKTAKLCIRTLSSDTIKGKKDVASCAAKCLASLCQAGGRVSVEDRWYEYVQMAIGSIGISIDHIMCAEDEPSEPTRLAFDMPIISGDFMVSIPRSADRITALSEVIVALLSRPTGVDVPVPINQLVDLASRLSLIPLRIANSKQTRAEYELIPLVTPQIYLASVRILAALAFSTGDLLQPFLPKIARAITAIDSRGLPSASVQVATYSLIKLYVERYLYGFVFWLPAETVNAILNETEVQNQPENGAPNRISNKPTGPSPKTKGKNSSSPSATNKASSGSSIGFTQHTRMLWTDTSYSALQTVLCILKHTPTILSLADRVRTTRQTVVPLLLQTLNANATEFSSRCDGTTQRAALLECLRAVVLSPGPDQKSIVPHAAYIFSAGLTDSSEMVRSICLDGLRALDTITHARLPAQPRLPDNDVVDTGSFVWDQDQIQDEQANHGKDVAARASTSRTLDDISSDDHEPLVSDPKRAKYSIAESASNRANDGALRPESAQVASLEADSPAQSAPRSEQMSVGTGDAGPRSVGEKFSVSDTPKTQLGPQNVGAEMPRSVSGEFSDMKKNADGTIAEEADTDNEDIPDIVMEGSDSEDE